MVMGTELEKNKLTDSNNHHQLPASRKKEPTQPQQA